MSLLLKITFTGASIFYQRTTTHQDISPKTQKLSSFDEFKELLMNIDVKTLSHPVLTREFELYQFIVQRYHSQLMFLGRRFAQ